MTFIAPTPKAESTIKSWVETYLAEELTDMDVIPTLAFNLPHGTGYANASGLNSINSVQLKDLQLLSLSYSKVVATVKVTANVSMTVYWEDYLASQEVRDLIGESDEFFSSSFDTDADFTLNIEFELLSEPPLVASHLVLSISGDYGSHNFHP